MKKILFLCSLFFYSAISFASHIFGGDLSYRYIGDSTGIDHHYEVTLKFYRDVAGVENFKISDLKISSSCYDTITLLLEQKIFEGSSSSEDGALTLSEAYGCMFSNKGEQKSLYLYKGSVVLSGVCADWKFSIYADCCRSLNVENLSDWNNGMYLYSSLNNMRGPNNSLKSNTLAHASHFCFSNWPLLQSIIQPFEQDIEGDSVFLELVHPLMGPATEDTIGFKPPYSVKNQLKTRGGIQYDPNENTFSFSPTDWEVSTICIQATEYRYDSITQQYYIVGKKQTENTINIAFPCDTPEVWSYRYLKLDTNSGAGCLEDWIDIDSKVEFLGSSMVPSDFFIMGKDSVEYIVKDVSYSNDSNSYATKIHLLLKEPFIKNDSIRVILRKGKDGNVILDKCGREFNNKYLSRSPWFKIENCYVSLPEEEITDIFIYPNPANDILYFHSKEDKKEKTLYFQILDYSGKLIKELSYNIKDKDAVPISINELPPGLYFIRIDEKGQRSYFSQFIKN